MKKVCKSAMVSILALMEAEILFFLYLTGFKNLSGTRKKDCSEQQE
jgi:hypothetical protein